MTRASVAHLMEAAQVAQSPAAAEYTATVAVDAMSVSWLAKEKSAEIADARVTSVTMV